MKASVADPGLKSRGFDPDVKILRKVGLKIF